MAPTFLLVRPPASQPFLPATRRVTAAAPPPSWAWRALPTPAGSRQPRLRRRRRPLPSFPTAVSGEAALQMLVLFTPVRLLESPKHAAFYPPWPGLPCAREWELRRGPLSALSPPSHLRPRGNAPPPRSLA